MINITDSAHRNAVQYLDMDVPLYPLLRDRPNKLAALATVDAQGNPACAVVGYAVTKNLTLIISTHATTRKSTNITATGKVALVIGWSLDQPHIQIEGTATVVTDPKEQAQCATLTAAQNPTAQRFRLPDTLYIRITPIRVRISDFLSDPPQIEDYIL